MNFKDYLASVFPEQKFICSDSSNSFSVSKQGTIKFPLMAKVLTEYLTNQFPVASVKTSIDGSAIIGTATESESENNIQVLFEGNKLIVTGNFALL